MEEYSKKADSSEGMTLLELELFVMNAKQLGIPPGARIKGDIGFNGKQKGITAINHHSPRRHNINS